MWKLPDDFDWPALSPDKSWCVCVCVSVCFPGFVFFSLLWNTSYHLPLSAVIHCVRFFLHSSAAKWARLDEILCHLKLVYNRMFMWLLMNWWKSAGKHLESYLTDLSITVCITHRDTNDNALFLFHRDQKKGPLVFNLYILSFLK